MENQNLSAPLNLEFWAHMLKKIRYFLDEQDFLEVTTPSIVSAGAMEASIDPLTVLWQSGKAELHTSPEFEMKQLLSRTARNLYQICRCFRDDPPTGIHFKEFTMLEFYRVHSDYRIIIQDMKTLIETLRGPSKFLELTVTEAIKKYAQLNWENGLSETELRKRIQQTKCLLLSEKDSWEDIFFKVLVEKVEPNLPEDQIVILTDYPTRVSPLSFSQNGITAERFEIYWQGLELCNGCTELRDKDKLLKSIERENHFRTQIGKSPHPFPDSLVSSIEFLPPCAGVAVGLERLALCLQA